MNKCGEKILLIGSPRKALMNPDTANGAAVCESILAGIEQAQSTSYETIAVLLSSIQGSPQQAVEALRRSSPRSRIILLAEMLEEPLARELTGRSSRLQLTADDYLICPVRLEELRPAPKEPTSAAAMTSNREHEYQERIRRLERLATEDDLTGLKNRRYLNPFLSQVLALARQCHFPVTLLVFDIDNFKQYNDRFGHAVGDQVLIQAGEMIRRCCRAHDVVARIGGDEFAVVFWDLPERKKQAICSAPPEERRHHPSRHPRQPLFMAERFRKEISASRLSVLGPGGQGQLTISGGLASFPDDGKTAEELLKQADEALLEAKRQGKNQIVIIGSKNSPAASAAEQEAPAAKQSRHSEKPQKPTASNKPQPSAESKKQSARSRQPSSTQTGSRRKKL